MIKMELEGVDDILRSLDKYGAAGDRAAAIAVRATVDKVRSDAIKSIQKGPKTGVTYERKPGQNLSASHTASAPGEAPATDTGNLISNSPAVSSGKSGAVSFNSEYAGWLEHGTTRIKPRPFLAPAVAKNQQFFIDQITMRLNRAEAEFNK